MTSQESVLKLFPDAHCVPSVVQGLYAVYPSPVAFGSLSHGTTPEEAWDKAAKNLNGPTAGWHTQETK